MCQRQSYQKLKNRFISIGGMKVNIVQIPEVVKIMEDWIENKIFRNYIIVSNANDVVVSRKNIKVREAVVNSSLSVPDGFSLVLLARMYGYPLKERVYGPDLMLEFLKTTEGKGYLHFFYGSTDNVLKQLVTNLKKKFPKLNVSGSYSPPFRELSSEEDEEVVNMINEASADVLWVGLGCPKQQLWMYEHKDRLKVPVMVGVGAAFDFLSETKKQAPKWMRNSGLEWLFRLVTEPRRLWKRYLIGNTIFIWLSLKELIKTKLKKAMNCK